MDNLEKIISNTQETVTIEELKTVLEKAKPKAYIGFEPSGSVHLGWKICSNKIKDFIDCGFDFIILLADWHAYINDKLGGDIEKIKLCGKYMEDCFIAMGVDRYKVNFVYASDYISDSKYWEFVLRTSKSTSIARVKRAMDHAHMLARDVSKRLRIKSPVAIHTPLLTGLQAGGRMDPIENKMSKSKPDSMISIHDDSDNVNRKIKKAYCPEKQVKGNPILEICKYVIFPELRGGVFLIERSEKFGGNLEFNSYQDLENAFIDGLHPLDLKNATAININKILEPIHKYFEKHPLNYNKMKELEIIQ